MPKYIVNRREVWIQMVEIEAGSEQEAIRRVADGEGDVVETAGGLEYSHTLDEDTWTADKVKES